MNISMTYAAYEVTADGSTFDVNVVADHRGATEPRTVAPGDTIGTVNGDGTLVIYEVTETGPWVEAAKQPEPGDLITCIGADAPDLAKGTTIVVLSDGTVGPIQYGMIAQAVAEVESSVTLTGPVTINVAGS